jgi:hypothetical protein
MSAIDEIMQQIPLGQLAGQLGVDEQTAGAAAQQAIPALLGGLQANAQDPDGAASLEGALSNHSSGLIDGGVDLSQVDTNDGQKIVSNIFGAHQDGVAQTLGGNVGGNSDLMQKLLPILAPIVMSYLAKRMGGAGGGGLLGSLLGGALGGGLGGGGAAAGGGGLADALGGMLGGGAPAGQPQQAGGGVLDLLGGMLGGGRR